MELLKPKGATLGLSLQESPLPGDPLIVSKIKEAGIADRCGAFHVGDRLLSLNKESLKNKSNTDVHHMLKHCDLNVEMEIIPAHNFPPPQRLECEEGREREEGGREGGGGAKAPLKNSNLIKRPRVLAVSVAT